MFELKKEGSDKTEVIDSIYLTEHDIPIDWYRTHGLDIAIIRDKNEEDSKLEDSVSKSMLDRVW